jgi:uncharacterized protein (UPF0248 family)
MDAVIFAVSQVLPGSENRIRQHPVRIMSIGFAIPLHRILKGCAFVESMP